MRRRKPGRPPKRPDSIAPRDRLLRSARKLFYEKGLATGVDELLAHARVAKMSLYTHFGSKDALATEYVVDADRSFKQWFDEQMALGPEDPGARLVHTFDVLAAWVERAGFCGCTFINAAIQLNDPTHPAFVAAVAEKAAMRDQLEALARAAGAREPAALARELSLLTDGALVAAAMEGSPAPVAAARRAAIRLVEASTSKSPPKSQA